MATRVRLPAGILREVDGPAAAQAVRGEARRHAWPAASRARQEPAVTYTPGTMRGMAADEIGALLLPGGIGEQHERFGADDSLMEDMLHKAASAASPGHFNSVPWDSSDNNSSARDYLRSVMSDMNRDVAVEDPLDVDIQQILDDPDAYIARTAAGGVAHVSRSLSVHQIHAQQSGTRTGAEALQTGKGRTRRLVQGTTFRDATNLGKSEVSGLPGSSARRGPQTEGLRQADGTETLVTEPQYSNLGIDSQDKSAYPLQGDIACAGKPRADEDVPLDEVVQVKDGQQKEMQALCERLQSLVASAKELAKTSAETARPRAPALPTASAPVHEPVAGAHRAYTSAAKAFVQPDGTKNLAWAVPSAPGVMDRDAIGEGQVSEGEEGARARKTGIHPWQQARKTGTHPWLDVQSEDDGTDALAHSMPAKGIKRTESDGQSVVRSPTSALKSVKSPISGLKSAQIATEVQEHSSSGKLSRMQGGGQRAGVINDTTASEAPKPPVVAGRKVNAMAGHKRNQAQHSEAGTTCSTEALRTMMSKLAVSWKNVGAMFNHFDRPDAEENGEIKGDAEISLDEFTRGIRDLKLDFSDDQIEEVFHLVDKDGSGSIDHSELEAVLQDCGVLKSVSVKRVPKSVNVAAREKEEKKIEEEATNEQDKKKRRPKGKGQPVDPPGMSEQVAEGLASLSDRVEELRGLVQEVRGLGNQFDLVVEQYNSAKGSKQGQACKAMIEAGEALMTRMSTVIKEYKSSASDVHDFSVALIHELPRDYRVVWKAAVCGEIDEKGGLVRVLNEEMSECEKEYMQMHEQCREWRIFMDNPALDFSMPKEAAGEIAVAEAFTDVMAQSRTWMKTAVGYGFANQKDVMRTLSGTKAPVGGGTLDSGPIMQATKSLADKLAPYVAEGTERVRALQEKRRAEKAGVRAVELPNDSVSQRSLGQVGAHSDAKGDMSARRRSVSATAFPDSPPDAKDTFALSVSTSHVSAPHHHPSQYKISHVSGPKVNYDALHEQLNMVRQRRSELEEGLDTVDLSCIEDASVDVEVRQVRSRVKVVTYNGSNSYSLSFNHQLVSSRLNQVARDVKESIAHTHDHTDTLAPPLPHAPPSSTPSSKRTGKAPPSGSGGGSSKAQGPFQPRPRVRDQRMQAAEEEAQGQGGENLAANGGRRGGKNKSVWDKLDDRRAEQQAKAKLRAKLPAPAAGLVRRTTKPPPNRIVSTSNALAPRGLMTPARHDRQARTHRVSRLVADTRVSRSRDREHVIPTGSSVLLVRQPAERREEAALVDDVRQGLLPLQSPAAKALSQLQQAAQENMVFCGVGFELHLQVAGSWTAVAEANLVRELATVLGVASSELGLEGRVSELMPLSVEVLLRHSKELAGDIVERVSLLARDAASALWALPQVAKVTVQGMIFEKSALHGSPPKEDLFQEAQMYGNSPQLASGVWEAVKAPMMREVEDTGKRISSKESPDLGKDLPALSSALATATSRRSLDFHEISGEGEVLPIADEQRALATPTVKHRDAEARVRVRDAGQLGNITEDDLTERVLSYLRHHILAFVETDAKFQRAHTWQDGDGEQDLAQALQMQRSAAGVCSPLVGRLLGTEGLMLLMQAGLDVEDQDVIDLAESNILEEARRVFRKAKAGGHDDEVAAPGGEDLGREGGLCLEPLPPRGRRQAVVSESTQSFSSARSAHDDAAAEHLILCLLSEAIACDEGDAAAIQSELDAETRRELDAQELREQGQIAAAATARRARDDGARQSVTSLLSHDGEGVEEEEEQSLGGEAGVRGDPATVEGAWAKGDARVGLGLGALEQPAPIAFDRERAEQHQQRVEDTLVRIADSMDALTTLTLQLAAVAERAPSRGAPQVGAVHVGAGSRQSPAHRSDTASGISASMSMAGESVAGSPVAGGTSGVPLSDDSPSSAIVESDYTPPKSTSPGSDEVWTPVEKAAAVQDMRTSIDFDVRSCLHSVAGWEGPYKTRTLEQATHSAQTSFDFENAMPLLSKVGCGESRDQELQTSVGVDESVDSLGPASSRGSPANTPLRTKQGYKRPSANERQPAAPAEPWAQSLISTLQSVAHEVSLLRESRLPQPSPPAAGKEAWQDTDAVLGDVATEREVDEKGARGSKFPDEVAVEAWLRAAAPLVDAGVQVCCACSLLPATCALSLSDVTRLFHLHLTWDSWRLSPGAVDGDGRRRRPTVNGHLARRKHLTVRRRVARSCLAPGHGSHRCRSEHPQGRSPDRHAGKKSCGSSREPLLADGVLSDLLRGGGFASARVAALAARRARVPGDTRDVSATSREGRETGRETGAEVERQIPREPAECWELHDRHEHRRQDRRDKDGFRPVGRRGCRIHRLVGGSCGPIAHVPRGLGR